MITIKLNVHISKLKGHTAMTVKYNGTEYDNEWEIRDAAADGKIHISDAAHMIVEIRTGMTNASHPDYQQEWFRVHAALAADKV
jgi:predicted secreted hydrolase